MTQQFNGALAMAPPMPVMTAAVIAALAFTGCNLGQAQGANGRCHEGRDAAAGSLTPGH
jgi:hypothetical protein